MRARGVCISEAWWKASDPLARVEAWACFPRKHVQTEQPPTMHGAAPTMHSLSKLAMQLSMPKTLTCPGRWGSLPLPHSFALPQTSSYSAQPLLVTCGRHLDSAGSGTATLFHGQKMHMDFVHCSSGNPPSLLHTHSGGPPLCRSVKCNSAAMGIAGIP